MPSLDNSFQQALDNFSKRLTKQELDDFKFSSLSDVLVAVENIQAEQGRHKELMNLTRIRRFLEAMDQYGKVIEVFLNTSSMLCFIWGPMKFCLQIASTWADAFDTLLDAYRRLAENIPLLEQYHALFKTNPRMTSVLAVIYENILEFHQTALRVFKRPTWKQLFRSAWKDFNTRFQHILDDLATHQALIERQASIIQIEEARIERAYVRNEFTRIEENAQNKKRLNVVNWLSAVDSVLDQEASATIRHDYPTTGKWILHDVKIKSWMDPNNTMVSIVWMNGIPGAGKTILASLIVEECMRIDSVTVIYFYCNYQDAQRRSFLTLARAMLAQLLKHDETLLSYLYESCVGSGQVSLVSTQLCAEILETCLKTMSKVYIVVDGIDECDLSERKSILSFFTSLIEKVERDDLPGKIRALFISQDENDIRRLLRTASVLRLTDSHNKSDIESYATQWSSKIQNKFGLPEDITKYITSVVCDGSDGMFLFAKLVLTNLFAQTTREQLYEELRPGTFPKGFEQAYARIVARVYQNPNLAERNTAQRLLGWIACSKRPLKWHEIQGAVSMNAQDQTVDFENRQLCTHVRDICGSLIDVLPGDRVQLVHGTAKSYLTHNDYVKIHNEEHKLAVLCLQYLLLDCFDADLSEEAIKDYTMKGYYAFEDYAVLHWVDHLEASIPYLLSNSVDDTDDIGSAVNDFQDAYGAGDASREDIPPELRDKCEHIKDAHFYESMLLLVSYTRKSREKLGGIDALGDLGHVIAKNRAILEGLHTCGNLDLTTKSKLEQYYGSLWHKCPRHACFYFHEGFPEGSRRDNHVSRHEKPFFCTESSCSRSHYGFSTEKELKKHTSVTHPDPSALFPKIKKPLAKHVCDICAKEYTRAHNLKAHKRTHDNLRPYVCEICGKAFVRKHDMERHVEKLHAGKGPEVGESSQETLVSSDMKIQEGDLGLEIPPAREDMASEDTMVS